MHGPLELLLADGVIEEPIRRLKSGKEADLWLVGHAGELVAAKVYKAREARSFRNNAGYKEGRQVRNTRTRRAMDRGSRFGQAAAEEAWKTKESDALHTLHAAGVRVPRPVLFHEGVLLMELVLDPQGYPAPRLADVHVRREEAGALYADLRAQVVRMLRCDLIHGDLSPYNVLLGQHGPVVIDFPQVVGAAHNSQAESFLRRDLENLRRFLAAVDPSLRTSEHDAQEIWRAYVRRELTPDFVPSGRVPPASPQRARPHGEPQRAGPHREPQRSPPHGEQRSPPHGEQRSPPHEGAAPRGAARPERGRHPANARPQEPAGGGRGRHGPAAPGRREPAGRGPDRRRAAPAPEVVRVVRPPLAGIGHARDEETRRGSATPPRADDPSPPSRSTRRGSGRSPRGSRRGR